MTPISCERTSPLPSPERTGWSSLRRGSSLGYNLNPCQRSCSKYLELPRSWLMSFIISLMVVCVIFPFAVFVSRLDHFLTKESDDLFFISTLLLPEKTRLLKDIIICVFIPHLKDQFLNVLRALSAHGNFPCGSLPNNMSIELC